MWPSSPSSLRCLGLLVASLVLRCEPSLGSSQLAKELSLKGSIRTAYSPRATEAKCPKDWMTYKKACYGLFTERKTWVKAQLSCRDYGPRSNLVSILNKEEADAVANFIYASPEKTGPVWIGMFDHVGWDNPHLDGELLKKRDWWWWDGYNVKYTAWGELEPNNEFFEENCVHLLPEKGFKKWNDISCAWKFNFICKYELKYM